jgi:hypothetical protein
MKYVTSNVKIFFDTWVISLIVDEYKLSEEEALRSFINSETYQLLLDEEMKFFRESPLVIFDMYQAEKATNNPRNSTYIKEMYPMYHIESIENAFMDINEKLLS